MITTGYGICVVISVLLTLIMALRNYDHIDSHDWSISLLLPFLIIAYWLKSLVSAPETVLVLFGLIGLLTTLLLSGILFSMLHTLGVRAPLGIRIAVYGLVVVLLFPLWRLITGGYGTSFV